MRARVDALGGSGRDIFPNPDGTGKPYVPVPWNPGDPFPSGGFGSGAHCDPAGGADDCIAWPGWAIAVALAVALVALGVWPASVALVVAVIALVVIALAGWIWHRACRNKFVCALLDKLVLGAVSASGVLGLGATVFGGAVRFGVLAGASIVATLGMLGIYFLRCREDCCE